MSTVFFISDLHLGHQSIIKWSSARAHFDSIEEHDEAIVDLWNKTVTKKDMVWVLGDVVFPETSLKHLSRLNGTKSLVAGNHDTKKVDRLAEYFNKVVGCVNYKNDYILTHIPIHPQEFGYERQRWKVNIHGHTHENFIDDPRYFNVSADVIGLKPIAFEEISKRVIDNT